MAAFTADTAKVLGDALEGFQEDLLDYMVSIVDDMSLEEKRSLKTLKETVGPFLLDSGFCEDDEEVGKKCQAIAIAFGGSGYSSAKSASAAVTNDDLEDDAPQLLGAPMKMIDHSGLKPAGKPTYGGTINATVDAGIVGLPQPVSAIINNNSKYDVGAIPTTQKQVRKMKKSSEQLQRMLEMEARQREQQAQEQRIARMAAIKASRLAGRQSLTGTKLEKFSLPHPSGTGDLLSDASLTLTPGRRYGLVGRNGVGKSTLLRALANYQLKNLTHLRIMLVDQHVEGDNKSPMEWVLGADVERTSLLEDEARLNQYLFSEAPDTLPEDLKGVNLDLALQECLERMDLIGVHTAPARAKKILSGLGFSDSMMERPTNMLSGGWAMRAALAAAVFVKPNLLLLDEPTNHLDLHALVWLENWLCNHYTGITLIVSHDRYFLNETCTDILELRSTLAGQKSNTLDHYSGDYSTYEATLEERKIVQARARVAFEREKEKLTEFISRDGKKYDNPAHQAQRKMRMKQLESLMEVEEVEEDSELVMTFSRPFGVYADTDVLISATGVDFGFPNEPPLIEAASLVITAKSRTVILGKNGCGKTTLLQLLMGELDPTNGGTVSRQAGSRITILQQHHYRGEQLDPQLNALEHMRRLPQEESTAVGLQDPGTRQEETAQRSYLANFGINGWRATIPIHHLSGGQRMRVALAVALYRRPDCIVLDEPSNHLDRDTVRALLVALESFEGAIIAVSHDEDFVNRLLAPRESAVKAAGSKPTASSLGGDLYVLSKRKLRRFEGSFMAYKKLVMKKVVVEE